MERNLEVVCLALALMAGVCNGCSRYQQSSPSTSTQTIALKAALVSPTDIQLTWKDPAANAAGYILEYTTDLHDEFTTLGFFQANQTTFIHPKLMPETTWYYRVRPYFGPTSDPIDVALPEALSNKEYTSRFNLPEDFSWARPRAVPDRTNVAKQSIRSAQSAVQAAPTDLKSSLVRSTVSGFQLTWTDHANDEDGYLLEMKSGQSPNYDVRALLDRGTNTFGYAFSPPERRATFRVRAFYYGQPSNLAQETTRATSSQNLGTKAGTTF